MFTGLDHIAIVVPDTDEALKMWRDRFGFKVLFVEKVNNQTVQLTHLDLGSTSLQLVQPLTSDHPLWNWLKEKGPGLHHICLSVNNVDEASEKCLEKDLKLGESQPHQGTQGKRALFLSRESTGNVIVELTGV